MYVQEKYRILFLVPLNLEEHELQRTAYPFTLYQIVIQSNPKCNPDVTNVRSRKVQNSLPVPIIFWRSAQQAVLASAHCAKGMSSLLFLSSPSPSLPPYLPLLTIVFHIVLPSSCLHLCPCGAVRPLFTFSSYLLLHFLEV